MPINLTAKTESSNPSSASIQSDPAPIINHPTFFFDNTLVVIQIENVRFNVHKYQLIKSKTFADLFAKAEQAKAEGEPVEGSSIENPIKLEGVSASDFGCLLTVLYATHFSTHQPEPEASLIVPAFRLANKWNFSDLRAYLLPLAEKVLEDVDKIVFAREFNIKNWLVPAHANLYRRSTSLTTDEATKLGIRSLLMISLLREEFPPSKPVSTSAQSCSGATVSCGYCGGRHTPGSHCTGCTKSSSPVPATSTQTVQERLKEWIDNDCQFKDESLLQKALPTALGLPSKSSKVSKKKKRKSTLSRPAPDHRDPQVGEGGRLDEELQTC